MKKILAVVIAVMVVFAFVSVSSAGLLKHPPKGGTGKRYIDPAAAAAMQAKAAQATTATKAAAPKAATAAKAAPVTIAGTVVSVNSMNGTVVVKDSMGINRTVTAGSKALAGIKAGDSISATIDGTAVSVTKQ
ncbi:MAG TPA: hypothetical protein PL155_08575 [Candidatus Omnitrophota bacterium]|nr:hypothetical protein [Candidatus Omnitrophota bacterium]HPD85491.1 hypothetical protein [Candidatus Omnitrophota bacterium]HRZ04008.1 hypothetical protein [Candidatus Omnitrophota bacterium]